MIGVWIALENQVCARLNVANKYISININVIAGPGTRHAPFCTCTNFDI